VIGDWQRFANSKRSEAGPDFENEDEDENENDMGCVRYYEAI